VPAPLLRSTGLNRKRWSFLGSTELACQPRFTFSTLFKAASCCAPRADSVTLVAGRYRLKECRHLFCEGLDVTGASKHLIPGHLWALPRAAVSFSTLSIALSFGLAGGRDVRAQLAFVSSGLRASFNRR